MRLSVTRRQAIPGSTPQAAQRELTAGAEGTRFEFIKNCGGVGEISRQISRTPKTLAPPR
jgi:hypothetical protein